MRRRRYLLHRERAKHGYRVEIGAEVEGTNAEEEEDLTSWVGWKSKHFVEKQ